MVAKPAKRPATYADLLRAPPHMVAEILAGELTVHPRPAPRHARASTRLGVKLGGPFDLGENGPGGWMLLDEPELHLREDVLVPDLAGWRRSRLPALPSEAWFSLRPDWVCEVLSASTEAKDRAVKLPIYAREEVPHVWLVDPILRTLEVFRLEQSNYSLLHTWRDGDLVRAEPFHEVELDLSLLWAD